MKHSALFPPKDEWQYRQRCRAALRNLLSMIGRPNFEQAVLSYLHLTMNADRVVTAWLTADEAPHVIALSEDDDYAALALDSLDQVPRSGVLVARRDGHPAMAGHLAEAGLTEEIRFGILPAEDRRLCAFVGRSLDSGAWTAAQRIMAEGCVTLLGSIVTAHVRCLTGQKPVQHPVSAEHKLVRAFGERGLTLRESEIASKILLGYSTLAIALEFAISENTVKVHRKHLNQKLGVRSQAELFGFAYRILMEGEALYGA